MTTLVFKSLELLFIFSKIFTPDFSVFQKSFYAYLINISYWRRKLYFYI